MDWGGVEGMYIYIGTQEFPLETSKKRGAYNNIFILFDG